MKRSESGMITRPITLTPEHRIEEAMNLMAKFRISGIPITEGEKIFAAADQPKAFWAMPGADHLLTRREDADRAAQVVGSWLDWTR